MLKELQVAFRGWIRRPFGTAALVVSLALAIGIVTGAYVLLDAILLRPFPYRDPTRLVYLWGSTNRGVRRGLTTEAIGVLSSSRALEGVSLLLPATRVAVGDDPRNTALAMAVDGGFLRLLGVGPSFGNGLSEDVPPADEREVLISFNAWHTLFAARPDIVGTSVTIDGAARTVVGVMPRGFFFPDPSVQLWVPHRREQRFLRPGQMAFLAVGRLASGRTVESAAAELATRAFGADRAPAIGIFPLTEVVVGSYRLAMWSLVGASVSLLLIVMANVGVILLVRVNSRRNELVIRAALGATTGRLCRQLLTEQLALAGVASVLGLMIAQVCVSLAKHVRLLDGSRILDASLGLNALGTLLLIALLALPLATVLLGHRLRSITASGLRWAAGPSAVGSPRAVLRSLVLFELTVTPPLLMAAMLFFSSFVRVVQTDWGFRPSAAAMVELRLPAAMEGRLEAQIELIEQAMHLIAARPEVAGVGMGYNVPIQHGVFQQGLQISADGRTVGSDVTIAEYRVSHGYFRALGTDIVRGREFTEADTASSERVVVINRKCARLLFPDVDPVGRQIRILRTPAGTGDAPRVAAGASSGATPADRPWRVVGVVGDIRMSGPEGSIRPVVYVEYRQQDKGFWYGSLQPRLIIRARRGSVLPLDGVSKMLRAQVAGLQVVEVAEMQDLMERSIGTRGSRTLLSTSASLLTLVAIVLVGIGVYALLSEAISRREIECGVRLALGAGPWVVVGELAREVLPVIGVGLALGLAACAATSRVIRAQIAPGPTDAWTWVLAGTVFVLTLSVAAVGPLRRALGLDPAHLLRSY